jgi:TonB family protein
MYIDFEDRPEIDRIGGAISRREGVLLSIIGHLLFVIAIVLGPRLPFVHEALEQQAAQRAEAIRQRELEAQRSQARRFVFVAPRMDIEAPKPPPIADDSDKNRVAQAPERSPNPTNPLPYARGNSPEMVEAEPEAMARGRGPEPEPARGTEAGRGAADQGLAEAAAAPMENGRDSTAPQIAQGPSGMQEGMSGRASVPGGSLGEALRNLERFARQQETFGNEGGGAGQFGPWIQFDTKGVEFGPWIRRFIAQIKRNWFIPYAAMAFKGHVVLTFNVHKNGSITDLSVLKPSSVDAFNSSAFNALSTSNPTQPLPTEYPSDKAFFTVTFYYNETPPSP